VEGVGELPATGGGQVEILIKKRKPALKRSWLFCWWLKNLTFSLFLLFLNEAIFANQKTRQREYKKRTYIPTFNRGAKIWLTSWLIIPRQTGWPSSN
jgi:hypothetical protein